MFNMFSMFLACLWPFVGGAPSKIACVHCKEGLSVLSTLHVFLHQFGGHTYDMLPLPVLDHVQGLQGPYDVLLSEPSGSASEGKEANKDEFNIAPIHSTIPHN